MNYDFPTIEHISDVLPHIENRKEFIVAERPYGSVINYVVALPETFDMTDERDLGGAIRRECRGLIFDLDGKIMSRPFHKFFNCGEKPETQVTRLDMSAEHAVVEKKDGSMIRPLLIDGKIHLATKMGLTDVAAKVSEWFEINGTPEQTYWIKSWLALDQTPLFEWVSPDNKIVVNYDKSELVLLAVRDNITGNYIDIYHDSVAKLNPFPIAAKYDSVTGDFEDYLADRRQKTNREGDIIIFPNGHRFKVKNDWYVRLHRVKDMISDNRKLVHVIINEEEDDLIPLLDQEDRDRVKTTAAELSQAIESTLDRLDGLISIATVIYEGNKKRVALELVPNLVHKGDSTYIFAGLDGKNIRTMLIEKIKSAVTKTDRFEAMEKWLFKL